MKSGRGNGEVKGLVFQAADENEFHEWLKVVGSSASGNPRVFGKAETGKLSHVTMNLKVNDHIIGKFVRRVIFLNDTELLRLPNYPIRQTIAQSKRLDDFTSRKPKKKPQKNFRLRNF